jgi:hypothetical protein
VAAAEADEVLAHDTELRPQCRRPLVKRALLQSEPTELDGNVRFAERRDETVETLTQPLAVCLSVQGLQVALGERIFKPPT